MVEVPCKFGAAFFANGVGDLVRNNGIVNAGSTSSIVLFGEGADVQFLLEVLVEDSAQEVDRKSVV